MIPRYTLLTVGVFCAGCASNIENSPSPAAITDAPAEVITLKFNWPAGAQAVLVRNTEEQVSHKPKVVTKITYTLKTSVGPDGHLLIKYEDPRNLEMTGMKADEAENIAKLIGGLVPELVVNEQGVVTGLQGTEAVKEQLDSMYPIPENLAPETKAMAQQQRSEAGLLSAAQNEWYPVVGFWKDRELSVGATYDQESQATLPFAGVPVTLVTTFGVKEITSCPTEPSKRCATLQLAHDIEPKSLEESLSTLVSEAKKRGDTLTFGEVSVHKELEVIVEIQSMLPYAFRQSDQLRLETVINGDRQVNDKRSERKESFKWRLPRSS